MRAALNQPVGLGVTLDPNQYSLTMPAPKTAAPPAQSDAGFFDTLFSTVTEGVKAFASQVISPQVVQQVVNKTLYGNQMPPSPTTMYSPGVPVSLQPKSALTPGLMLAGVGLVALVLLRRKR